MTVPEHVNKNKVQEINTNSFTDVLNSVKYKDVHMRNTDMKNKPVNLGVGEIDKNIKKVLSRPTGYALYKDVKSNDVEVSIEESFAKMRLNKIYKNKPQINSDEMDENKIDFRNSRATDMRCNKRVHLINPSDFELETKLGNLKIELMKGFNVFQDENPNCKNCNLDIEENDGLKKIVKSNNENKTVVFKTDKSKKFSVDLPNNYKHDMEIYVQNDKIVDKKFVNKITNKFNDIGKSLIKILRFGEAHGHEKRALQNIVIALNGEIPVKSGMYKDHKDGRKYRPFVNGNIGPISNVSNLMNKVLAKYVERLKIKTGCTI